MEILHTKLLAEGGELIELLVLLLVMVLSAIGSLIKNRTQTGPKKSKSGTPKPANIQKKQRSHPARIPELNRRSKTPEIADENKRGSILQRIPLPLEPSRLPEQPPQKIPTRTSTVAQASSMQIEEPQETVTALKKTEMFPGQVQAQQFFLQHEDLKRAIVINEILGPPKALQDLYR